MRHQPVHDAAQNHPLDFRLFFPVMAVSHPDRRLPRGDQIQRHGGAVSMDMVDGIVDIVNGKFFGGLGKVISGYFRNSKLNKEYEAKLK